MLLKIAWRNIWRNKRRSAIVITSIIVGIIAMILTESFSMGFIYQMLENQVRSNISHIQIHKKGFVDNKVIQNFIPNAADVENVIKKNQNIEAYSKRIVTFGLLSSARNSSGVIITGIDPILEKNITKIKSSIVQGSYFGTGKREIVLGKRLAEKLDVRLGDKVVAMASAVSGDVGSDVFRVTGIFETESSEFDKTSIFIPIQTAQNMLELENNISEFALILNDSENADKVKNSLLNNLSDEYEVLTYKDIVPLLVLQFDMFKQSMMIIYFIIGLALIFGIINTMLMSVFERINEIGVLMAIGMKGKYLFFMILLEALILGIIGTVIGVIIGMIIYLPLSYWGIDLRAFAESLTSLGTGAVIYPLLTFDGLMSALFIIPFISVLAAIYPAYRAIKLEPIKAINYI